MEDRSGEWRLTYEEWEQTVSEAIRLDSLWKMAAYRKALFLADLGWPDVTRLAQDRRTTALSDQLFRAMGSISANIAEGYSRGSGTDRAHFYEYALGSLRETTDWYFKARHVLGDAVVEHRFRLLVEIRRLLLTSIPQQRGRLLRETDDAYQVDVDGFQQNLPPATADDES